MPPSKPAVVLGLRDFVTLRKYLIWRFSPLGPVDPKSFVSPFLIAKPNFNYIEFCVSANFKNPFTLASVLLWWVQN